MNSIFVERASTYQEAEKKAREKYGDRVTILEQKTVSIRGGFLNLFTKEGVEITGMIPSVGAFPAAGKPPLRAPVTSLTALPTPSPTASISAAALEEEKEKFRALANSAVGKENAGLKEVLAEVKAIKEKLENQGLASSREEHPTLNRIDDLLILNDFPLSYRTALLDRMRKEITLNGLEDFQAVQDKVLVWIGESIKIYQNDKFNVRPRIIILVGPTGIGKTTTIVKLAANFGLDEKAQQKRSVAFITTDTYRIGAKQQLEKYGEVIEFPCYSASNTAEMKEIITANSECIDLFLIDTPGRSPRDMIQLAEMKQLLDSCGTLAEAHLALAATTKASDIKEILKQFETFDYRSVLITKMDETMRVGNIIGALAEKGKCISYTTNGQKVPTDIRKANVIQFLINLEGFRVNRMKIEEMFPDNGEEQMQKWG
ncbi:MAG: flagellar biosynthesis protein FlhF [Treponema sp.]|nr:flagellar biosynthesis protein FlhF [Treponema sp.]